MFKKNEFYCLTVAIWSRAVEAGMRPVKGFHTGANPLAGYHEHKFYFQYPPTRRDWWDLCDQTPWMTSFKDQDQHLINSNSWPLVGPHHKSCTVDLLDAQLRKVGMVDVNRHEYHLNARPQIPMISVDHWDAIVRGLKGEAHGRAREWVMCNQNVIQEALMDANEPITDALIHKVGKQILREKGFIKGKDQPCQFKPPRSTSKLKTTAQSSSFAS